MKDRVSKHPGRVLITPEDGSPAFYATMTRADEPTQAGDPINKTTLLTDNVAAMFGWGAEAVPNDVAGYVGQYAQHQWFRKAIANFVIEKETAETTVVLYDESSGSVSSTTGRATISYYNRVELDFAQNIYFPNASVGSADVRYSQYTGAANLRGHYFEKNGVFYYAEANAQVRRDTGGNGYRTMIAAKRLTVLDKTDVAGESYLHSSDPDAYPHSGETGGYTYTYLGRAMEHVRREPVRVLRSSYLGTGTYGASNPQQIRLPFKKILALIVLLDTGYTPRIVWAGQPGTSSNVVFTETEGQLSWYGGSAILQCNESGVFYHYIAIGLDSDREEN